MVRKKDYTGDRYMLELLQFIKRSNIGVSTGYISERFSMGYETSLKYLRKLNRRGLINYKNVGNRRYWFVKSNHVRCPRCGYVGLFIHNVSNSFSLHLLKSPEVGFCPLPPPLYALFALDTGGHVDLPPGRNDPISGP